MTPKELTEELDRLAEKESVAKEIIIRHKKELEALDDRRRNLVLETILQTFKIAGFESERLTDEVSTLVFETMGPLG